MTHPPAPFLGVRRWPQPTHPAQASAEEEAVEVVASCERELIHAAITPVEVVAETRRYVTAVHRVMRKLHPIANQDVSVVGAKACYVTSAKTYTASATYQ